MISEKEYRKLLQYSKKLAKHENDIEDIAQEASIMVFTDPPDGKFTKQYYWVITKRAKWHFYYKKDQTNKNFGKTILKNQDILVEEIPEVEYDIKTENLVFEKEIKTKLRNLNMTKFTQKEIELLNKILEGYEPENNDRGHYHNLKQKITKIMSKYK